MNVRGNNNDTTMGPNKWNAKSERMGEGLSVAGIIICLAASFTCFFVALSSAA